MEGSRANLTRINNLGILIVGVGPGIIMIIWCGFQDSLGHGMVPRIDKYVLDWYEGERNDEMVRERARTRVRAGTGSGERGPSAKRASLQAQKHIKSVKNKKSSRRRFGEDWGRTQGP